VEVGVGRAGDGAGETGRIGGDGGDKNDDDGRGSAEFEGVSNGDRNGGGVERIGNPPRA